MARIMISIAVALTFAAFCFTESIEDNLIKAIISSGDGKPMADISEAKIGIPTIEILKALDDQMPEDVARGTGFFNLTAYLSSNPNPGQGGLTFVPLITLLLGIAGVGV